MNIKMKPIVIEDHRVTKLTVCIDKVRIKFNKDDEQHKLEILDFFNNVITELSEITQTYRGTLRIQDGYFKIRMSTNQKHLAVLFQQSCISGNLDN
jgi:hypothetical protein